MALLCCVYVVGCEKGQQMVETVVESPAAEEIPTEVNLIPDANLAAAIRETLGLSVDAPLTAEVLRDLKKLEAPGRQIADLTGLEYATNLAETLFNNYNSETPNQISDVSPLSTLTNLTHLHLSRNQLSDVSALATLTNLTVLNLYRNQLSDVSALATLTNLTVLNLGGNQLSDVSALATLTNLTRLNLYRNQLSDVSALATLTNLQLSQT
jgi:Leucine-rich repeat (LRR) protein